MLCPLTACAGYVGSMGATLYAALVMHSYIMSLICCAVQVYVRADLQDIAADSLLTTCAAFCALPPCALLSHQVLFEQNLRLACIALPWRLQVVALLYYALSYFPGGSAGVRFVLNLLISGFWQCCLTVQKTIFR